MHTHTFVYLDVYTQGFPGGPSGKEPACRCRRRKRRRFNPWVGKIPWRRPWRPPPVFLPGESRGQRGLAGYSPWGHKESGATERLTTIVHTHTCTDTHIPPTHVCVALNHDSASFSEDTLPPLGRGRPCHKKSTDFPGGGGGFCRISMVFLPLEIFF